MVGFAEPFPLPGRTRAPHAAKTPSIRCQYAAVLQFRDERSQGRSAPHLKPWSELHEERRLILLGPAHPLADHPVHERVVLVGRAAVPADVLLRRAGEPRRRVRGEDVSDLVGALDVEHEKIRQLAVVEVARRSLVDARRREDPGERDDRVLHPFAATRGLARSPRGGSVDEAPRSPSADTRDSRATVCATPGSSDAGYATPDSGSFS